MKKYFFDKWESKLLASNIVNMKKYSKQDTLYNSVKLVIGGISTFYRKQAYTINFDIRSKISSLHEN